MKISNIIGICATVPSQTNSRKRNNKYNSVNNTLPAAIKTDEISFGMRVDYGVPASLAEHLQKKVTNIHENLDLIQNFFTGYTAKNPQLGALIKKGFSDLIPKRQSGIVFKLPDTKDTLEIMRSQTRKNILYISINNDSADYNGIVIDGQDKLIANYLKKHPHMLPRGIKYMDSKRMEEAEPEKFINLADEKIQKYGDYVRKLKTGELPMPKLNGIAVPKEQTTKEKYINRISPPKHKKVETKPVEPDTESFEDYINKKITSVIKKILNLFSADKKDLPPHITPKLASNGSVLGFSLQTDDGGALSVTKKIASGYGNSMPYLSFEKVNKDKSLSFLCYDLISNKILRTKDKGGKPYISSKNIVYELTPAEIKRCNIEQKFDYYEKQIFKNNKKGHSDNADNAVKSTTPKIKEKRSSTVHQSKQVETISENLKNNMREWGKQDGKFASDEYFEAFKEEFIKNIKKKMQVFNAKVDEFLKSL